jgi:hypothetical protein
MADMKLKLESSAKTEEKVTTAIPAVEPFKYRVPSAWHILAGDKPGTITAVCSISQESFEGTTKDFNIRMRG